MWPEWLELSFTQLEKNRQVKIIDGFQFQIVSFKIKYLVGIRMQSALEKIQDGMNRWMPRLIEGTIFLELYISQSRSILMQEKFPYQ